MSGNHLCMDLGHATEAGYTYHKIVLWVGNGIVLDIHSYWRTSRFCIQDLVVAKGLNLVNIAEKS